MLIFALLILPFALITGVFRGMYDGLLFWYSHFINFKGWIYADKKFMESHRGFNISMDNPIYKKI